ncbi:nucleophile aminohydrolase [Ochromonadaceae sp. CCMP2298]|nr:nucleophile aminohydrolase [Ochromonadaceae sp. CCMP2298]|mmetsp:Transcript_7192/g.15713  ORF Transcript_7192/g.15713 Transcript_7192/m.15713 type:complete len:193 (+) Transcript_7192:128-706(+)|eukprot:CAMPEP_0173212490 /NCGR_PEP_ID=MMETSP1141-20130122/24829_1 /TAXON_ID=483371 /ORGANISM="non described non described, Strain CCMP2298" /LENGTH=192 /DNA_ID=CAMNT_0014139515 /DNA_START=65 /DNA_END=640 /DNA_ORIENTATION=-
MDTVFSLVGDGFALVVADASAARSILVFKHDEDKILALDSHKLMVGAGVPADCATFNEYVQKNLKLYELNNDIKLSTRGAANYIRGELATAMRKGPYQTNLLLAGFDPEEGVSLFLMDYMAALSKVNFGAHGYAAAFILSVFDRDWVKGMDLAQSLEVVRKCIHELKTRFLISQPVFIIKLVDASGTRVISL